MSNVLEQLLARKPVVFADGGTGTNLFEAGLANGASCELWNVDRPEVVRTLQGRFVDAGADILLTNTFGANRFRFKLHALEDRVHELNVVAARLTRGVADAAGRPVVVAGDIGPTGELIAPLGEQSAEAVEAAFYEQAIALKEGGADIAWIETMFADSELEAAVRAVQRAGLPYVATMSFDSGGRTMMGIKPVDAMRRACQFEVAPLAFGANCGIGPAQLLDSILGLAEGAVKPLPIVAKGNCGLPVMGDDGQVRYDGTPEIMANYACLARDAGARIIGGCCGTKPVHLEAMVKAVSERPRGPLPAPADIERVIGPIRRVTSRRP
ncbi:MAG TPA: betaine--homocysteine S-methyltransferase [Burkholderiaceae bacterium]|jgi:methionine synthase I (cobalamin-dependent)|nr:betaine--homocysteine S-methyltransferase [Burkholderiaceae bacterium]